MNGIGRILNLLRKETPSPGTNYTGTVTKVEGGVAYVQLAGSDIDDTPVRMSVAAKKGDTVRVTVNKGKAWITGNDTAPPTDDSYAKESEIVLSNEIEKTNVTLKRVDDVATEAHKIAGNTDQYFWHVTSGTDTGAHLTEKPQKEFLADPENGGGNLLARSNGIAVRDGLTELAQFGQSVILGQNGDVQADISSEGIKFKDPHGTKTLSINTGDGTVRRTYKELFDTDIGIGESKTFSITSQYVVAVNNCVAVVELWEDDIAKGSEVTDQFAWDTDSTSSLFSGEIQFSFNGTTHEFTVTRSPASTATDAHIVIIFCWDANIYRASMTLGSRSGKTDEGAFSATIGEELDAAFDNQFVIGKYNANGYNAFEIGNGEPEQRRNIFSVDYDGNVNAVGEVTTIRSVSIQPPIVKNVDIGVRFFSTMYSPFQPVRVTAYQVFDGMIYFSIEIFINGTFVPNYGYRIGKLTSLYCPLSTMSGSGHSTDGNFNPKGTVTWLLDTYGDMQILLQSTDGPYVFISGMYML